MSRWPYSEMADGRVREELDHRREAVEREWERRDRIDDYTPADELPYAAPQPVPPARRRPLPRSAFDPVANARAALRRYRLGRDGRERGR